MLELLYYQERMRALGVSSVLDLLSAGLAVPEHSDPRFEVARILWPNFSPQPRSDKRVRFGLGSESRAKIIEIDWPSGRFQTPESIPGKQGFQIDEPAGGAAPR